MPNEYNQILKNNPGENSMKVQFIIYVDLACLLKKCIHVKMTPKNLLQKKCMHISSGCSLFQCSFDAIKHKLLL